ncbi:GNAT family N-acetyltransferase [Streptomyces tateyamensis]|uniref:GNAT family N-acetyltransferase n=1 Tax=Streptomyces tateyamensis TaxID=565073 RepID=A0A2V4NI62_9ACTN|nr:GNAT family N-acetyltransferase [Streptomyces tateyamensis]PYC66476.1 GNAT family N-acetyltransferase [Streptomyces tateyamensis]
MTEPLRPVELTGPGLLLRPWTALPNQRDAADLRVGLSDPEQARWNPNAPLTDPGEQAVHDWVGRLLARTAEGTGASWAVRDPDSGRLLGHLGLREVEFTTGSARIGYWIMPGARGRGLARAATELASRWAFGELGLHRIELAHAVGHEASCAIARRAGYRLEGVLREALPDSYGTRHDLHLHARLATDPVG